MEKEVRKINDEVKFDTDSRLVEGYALLFNHESRDLGFTETISPGAISQEMVDNCDVWALFNHNEDQKLARSNRGKGNLKLEVDDKGLKYSFRALNNQLGNELLEYLETGMINESSFAFNVSSEGQEWSKDAEGRYFRKINKINALFDVSPVWEGAYSHTDVAVATRSLEEYKAQEVNKAKEDLSEYFKNLRKY